MKKKFLLAFSLVALLIVIFAISVSAADPVETWDISATGSGNVTAYLYTDPENEGVYTLTISGTGNMKDWISYPSVPWYSSYSSDITSVTIEEGVTSIGNYTFYGCSSLANIVIPDSVTSIGNLAFYGCSNLIDITVNDGNTNYKSIDGNLYSYDGKTLVQYAVGKSNESFTIPEGVTSIGGFAFQFCSNLASIVIPEGVTSIGDHAFQWCSSLTSIVIPEGVTTIGGSAFDNCCNLTSIVIPEGVTSIGNYTFYGCSSLANIVIPEGVTSIGDSAFRYCLRLTNIVIPDSVTSIGNRAFSECSSLTSMVIPEGVTSIGFYAFSWCQSLTSIVIPEGVTTIGGSAFERCSSLTSIVIPEGVTSIGDEAFYGCSSLANIVIPEGVTSIGDSAFQYCLRLTNIVIPDSVTSIGNRAFYSCFNLIDITVNDGNTNYKSIDGNLYSYDGKKLIQYAVGKSNEAFTIPDSVTSIGDGAFFDCYNIASIVIPDSVTSIGNYAFYYCSSLTSIVIPEGVTSIGDYAFNRCSSLTIYCEATNQPSGWDTGWNPDDCPVVWGYFDEEACLNAIFTFKGYSFNESGSMAVGFDIDYKALAKYEEKTGKTLEIGVVFAGYDSLNGSAPLDQAGNEISLENGFVVKFDITPYNYLSYDFVITGIDEAMADTALVIAAYIYNGENVKYEQENGLSDTVTGISYNQAQTK